MAVWNPWHGCRKISPGCYHCYVYRRDAEFGKDSSHVAKTANFDLPLKKNRKKEYKLQREAEPVYTCMTSDFFLHEADEWRQDCWRMIRERSDLDFVIITKRIDRFTRCIPEDWGDGYENVTVMCTCENQNRADYRLPIFLELPIRHKQIIHEPMLERIEIGEYLKSGQIERVVCGGESGADARLCDYAWILDSMRQCMENDVAFHFRQTGALFRKGERVYRLERKDQLLQAQKAGADYVPERLSSMWKTARGGFSDDGQMELEV